MIPQNYTLINKMQDMPSKTYKINWENGHIEGFIDGKTAIAQAVELAVSTERGVWKIYSNNYGSDVYKLIGKSNEYAMSEMKRMIDDSLVPDSRIDGTTDFKFDKISGGLTCDFTAKTTAGDVSGTV